ncbi:hypothetical protein AAVH_22663 [Aphelenchoides avenae]|nr:hypothetical protein AAVH_22663 [Aphelenchus avenae]
MNEIFDTSLNPFDSTFAVSSTQAPTALAASGGGGQWFLPPSERNGAGAVSVRPMVEVAPARTTSSEDHVHVFGPPYNPEMAHVGGNPTYPAPPLPPSDIPYPSPNMSPLSPTNPYTVRDGEENPTVDPSVFSTTYGRYGRKRGDPWTWRELAGKLKRKPLYSLDNGEVFDRSIRCCQWALDGLCDRSWQRIRQLCPKSCGTVICSSSDGALSCNRAIDVDVIDCYERRRFRAYGTTSTGVQRAPHPTSHLADDPSQQGVRPVGHRQAPAMKFAKGWVNDATPVDASGQARRLGISGGYRSAYTIEEEIKAYRLRHGFRS